MVIIFISQDYLGKKNETYVKAVEAAIAEKKGIYNENPQKLCKKRPEDPKMTPKELGYYFPAEWVRHEATWLNYPHNENSWPDKIDTIFPSYHLFIKLLADVEKVHINVLNNKIQETISTRNY